MVRLFVCTDSPESLYSMHADAAIRQDMESKDATHVYFVNCFNPFPHTDASAADDF